jgi:dihydroorotase
VTTRKSVDQIRAAKAEGVQVTASTTAHHLLLNDTAVRDSVYSTSMRLLPPLRSEADRLALCTGVRDETIDAVVSQHTPWTRVEKEVEFELSEPGATGVQTAFNETLEALDGDYCAALRALSSGPNRLLGRQPGLVVGASADFFLWDAEAEWSLDHHSNCSLCQNSPVWERGFRGKVVSTYRKGLKIEVG